MRKRDMPAWAGAGLLLLGLGGCVVAPLPPRAYPPQPGYPAYPPPPGPGAPMTAPEPGPVIVEPPPPAQTELMPVAPGLGYVWIGGYWTWHLGRHVWIAGRWAVPPAGYVWAPGWWGRHGRGWRWHGGYWRRR